MDKEIWNAIPSLGGKYEASSEGRIRNFITKRVRSLKPSRDGYVRFPVKGITLYVHRLVFEAFCGYIPIEIDHADNNRSNNCISNLSSCTREENLRFRYQRKMGEDGYFFGANWREETKSWRARTPKSHGRKWLGTFKTPQEASRAVINYMENTL